MKPHELGILVVAGGALVAWLLRSLSGDDRKPDELQGPVAGRGDEGGPPWPPEEDLTEEEIAEAQQLTVVTSDGWSFVPRAHSVQLLPPVDPEEMAAATARARRAEGGGLPGIEISKGDLLGARVVRGAPGVDPWRVEGLGRDREYRWWAFETEDAARAALDMLARLVVRPAQDEYGEPVPPGPEDFAEARKIYVETEEELAMMPEEEDYGPGGGPGAPR